MDENYEEKGKIWQKMQDNPTFPIGIVGLTGIVAYNLYRFKNRGSLKPSIYLIHMRLNAQGTLIGCLAVGLLYSVSQKLWAKYNKDK